MSMQDLHDLAKQLHDHEEKMRGNVRPGEFELLAKTVLQAIHELSNLERRILALEGKSSHSN